MAAMAAHDRIAARHGISMELLTDLREADAAVIGLKDHRPAIARVEIGQRVQLVALPAQVQLVDGHSLAPEEALGIAAGPTIVTSRRLRTGSAFFGCGRGPPR